MITHQLPALIRLDLKLYFRDRRAWILLFIIPIGIASFMGALTTNMGGSGRGKSAGLQLLITDLDESAASRGVIRAFTNDANFTVTVTNETVARELVLGGRRPVALVLPKDFGRNALPGLLFTNRKPVIQLYHDPSRSMERQLVEGVLVPKVIQSVVQNSLSLEGTHNLIQEGIANVDNSTGLGPRQKQLLHDLMTRSDEWLSSRTNQQGRPNQAVPPMNSRCPCPSRSRLRH